MKEKKSKQILLCVSGLSPQIITETLYVLTQKERQQIDEIRVITTLSGRDKVKALLLDPEKGKFYQFCREFGLDAASIKFDESMIYILRASDWRLLEDIRLEQENDSAADQICEIVRELTSDANSCIHASVAGGRKTMSIYLTIAMQLFGRAEDRLSHVLISEDFEQHPEFFYKPIEAQILDIKDRFDNIKKRVSTESAEIYLADIPFIRLRGLMPERINYRGLKYSEFVKELQHNLTMRETLPNLHINIVKKTVVIMDREVRLEERELYFYLLFAYYRKHGIGEDGFMPLLSIKREDLDKIFRMITAARDNECGLEQCHETHPYTFLQNFADRLVHQNKEEKDLLKKTFREIKSKLNGSLRNQQIPSCYFLDLQGSRGKSKYGLNVPRDRISWS